MKSNVLMCTIGVLIVLAFAILGLSHVVPVIILTKGIEFSISGNIVREISK